MGFRAAHIDALKERTRRVIFITKGDIGSKKHLQPEPRAYLNANICLDWDDKKEQQFFNKLRLAIAYPKCLKTNRYATGPELV